MSATASAAIGLFPGQGSQYAGMGKGLAERFSAAAQVFDEASEALSLDLRRLCWDAGDAELGRTENAQPAIVTVSIAAWRAWLADQGSAVQGSAVQGGAVQGGAGQGGALPSGTRSDAVVPAAVAGHSVGAVSAAIASGHLELAEGIRLVRRRGELMASAPGDGAMVAVSAVSEVSHREVLDVAAEIGLDVAARNGSRQLVLSGARETVAAAKDRFGGRARVLDVSHAFHSRYMDPIVPAWSEAVSAAEVLPGGPIVYLASTTGVPAASVGEVRDDLRLGIRNPVRWDRVVEHAAAYGRWIAFGPGTALARFGRGVVPPEAVSCVDDHFKGRRTA